MGLSDHTTESNKQNALFLAFRFRAIIPLEVDLPTIRTKAYDVGHNEKILGRDLDFAKNEERT